MVHYRRRVCDAEKMESGGAVRLEWWYDLDRPFLADADLLEATSRYTTSITTEDGVFAASVRLPTTEMDSRLSLHLQLIGWPRRRIRTEHGALTQRTQRSASKVSVSSGLDSTSA